MRVPRSTDNLLGDLPPGTRIGEYAIERLTGHSTYAAAHAVLPRRVSIKVIPAAQMRPGSISIDLLREACIVEALDHPGIPRIYECGLLNDGRPWIATELIEGTSLATRAPATMREAAALVRDVADILAHAHLRGVIHHNVVAESILYPHAQRWFPISLVDWSLARSADMRWTDDIHALGTIARRILHATPVDARPPIFTALVERMLADDPHRRPTADNVRDHATWLTMQMAQEIDHSVPTLIEDERTDELLSVRNAIITSELTPEVTGEID